MQFFHEDKFEMEIIIGIKVINQLIFSFNSKYIC
jgi:hypothetical protein